jgi:hypothetical protein
VSKWDAPAAATEAVIDGTMTCGDLVFVFENLPFNRNGGAHGQLVPLLLDRECRATSSLPPCCAATHIDQHASAASPIEKKRAARKLAHGPAALCESCGRRGINLLRRRRCDSLVESNLTKGSDLD